MKGVITQATEKGINDMLKSGHKYAIVTSYLLDEMKGSIVWYGATIKKMKEYGAYLLNSTQIRVSDYYQSELNGLSVLFDDLIYACFTNGLHYVSIYDY